MKRRASKKAKSSAREELMQKAFDMGEAMAYEKMFNNLRRLFREIDEMKKKLDVFTELARLSYSSVLFELANKGISEECINKEEQQ